MLTKVITLRFNSTLDGFDDAPLRDFIKDKEVLSIRNYFFIKNEAPYLTIVINYTLKPLSPEKPKEDQKAGKRDESWRHWVDEADVPLFNALRDWRSARCKREGFPPYIICTNRQLAAMVAARPQSLAKLGEIEGFGQAKLEKYGKEILAILATAREEPLTAQSKTETQATPVPEDSGNLFEALSLK